MGMDKWAFDKEAEHMEDMAICSSAYNEEMILHPANSTFTKEEKPLLGRMSGEPENLSSQFFMITDSKW